MWKEVRCSCFLCFFFSNFFVSELDGFGRIRRVVIVRDKEGKSRGYAFVEFEEERAMRRAYKEGDGMRVKGKR